MHLQINSLTISKIRPLWIESTLPHLTTRHGFQYNSLHSLKGSRGQARRLRLSSPRFTEKGTYQPPRYFSQGALDNDPLHNPEPIPYLLVETHEVVKPRPVPGNSLLFRSLCKGKGRLRRSSQGLIYLDIDNRCIEMMIPYLKAYGLVAPPYFSLSSTPQGAHIPVIAPKEALFHHLDAKEALGEEFTFTLEGLYSVEPTLWPQVEEAWFFQVEAPMLEELRRKWRLPPRLGGHPFHVVVAVKSAPKQPILTRTLPMMRINVAFLAA